jgi:hypothetical protein
VLQKSDIMGRNMQRKFQCTQCGATDLVPEGEDRLRCRYCRSIYEAPRKGGGAGGGAKLHIMDGAKVIVGEGARVVVRGDVVVDRGADVKFAGTLVLLEPGSDEDIRAAKTRLVRESPGGE